MLPYQRLEIASIETGVHLGTFLLPTPPCPCHSASGPRGRQSLGEWVEAPLLLPGQVKRGEGKASEECRGAGGRRRKRKEGWDCVFLALVSVCLGGYVRVVGV
jgi:hypothetical protein